MFLLVRLFVFVNLGIFVLSIFPESGLHIWIKKNGHPRLIQLTQRARTILDERAKSAKDNLVFPFKNNWYRDE